MFIRPTHKAKDAAVSKCFSIADNELESVLRVDREIHEASKRLNLTKILRPKNYYEELDAFIAANGLYDPYFRYDLPSPEELSEIWKVLEDSEATVRKDMKSSAKVANAFIEKIRELKIRTELVESVSKQDFSGIEEANTALF